MDLLWVDQNADGTLSDRHDHGADQWLGLIRARQVAPHHIFREIDGLSDPCPLWVLDARRATALVTLHRAVCQRLWLMHDDLLESIAIDLLSSQPGSLARRACFEVLQGSASEQGLDALLAAASRRDVIDSLVRRASAARIEHFVARVESIFTASEWDRREVLFETLSRLTDDLAWSLLARLLASWKSHWRFAEIIANSGSSRAWPLLRAFREEDLPPWVHIRSKIGDATTLDRATVEEWLAERYPLQWVLSYRMLAGILSLDESAVRFLKRRVEHGPSRGRACELLCFASWPGRSRFFDRLCRALEREPPPKKLPFDSHLYTRALLRACDEPARVAALLTKLWGHPLGLVLIKEVDFQPRTEYIPALQRILTASAHQRNWASATRHSLRSCLALQTESGRRP